MLPLSKKTLLGLVAALATLLAAFGVTLTVSDPDPGTVPPSPTASSTPIPPPVTTPSPVASGCVAPPGMTKLIDQDPSDSQVPWKRNGAAKVTIYFSAPVTSKVKNSVPLTDEWFGYLQQGAAVWNKSPCLDVRVIREACPAGQNCVTVAVLTKGDDGNFNDVVKDGYTVGGNIELLASLGNTPNGGQRRNVAAHEEGHAVGLVHRKAKVLMNGDTYPDIFDADPDEYKNLLYDYGRQK